MSKFVYKLQNVLNLKLKMEDQAKQAFSTAQARLNDEEEALQALQQRKRVYEERAKTLLSGVLQVREIESNKNAILVMDGFIANQRTKVEQARMRVEQAREQMMVAMQERKTQEILRDRAFEEFLREENRAESKAIDELTSYVYGQKAEV
ncbi:MAG: flagellar export protein FliJ [Lachnospiraceae bacterium]|nr:flagellar export protein FliJ [Lachnospiraceae bacterium]